jgi:lauroyl/myristoyl acyltransferase
MEDDWRGWWQGLAVRGVLWRRGLDWAIANVPFYFHPFLICFWTTFFFLFAAPARKTIVSNLAVVLPGSWRVTNYLRAFRTFYNFAWTIAEGTTYKLNKAYFSCELSGANFMNDLLAAKGAIILTAHMGSYDLGAALFTEKFQRTIRMIRAPEPDKRSAQHIDLALEQAGAGAVKVDYSTEGASLSFDLLNALRNGEIVSIQGDRVMDNVASSPAKLFGRKVSLPSGPFILSLVTPAPIYPLFIVRLGYRRYQIIVREPIVCVRTERPREDDLAEAMTLWSRTLESVTTEYWNQWYAFAPIF